jgi:outer membrane protein TolC
VSLKIAKSSYLPSFGISTGWGGNASQYTDAEFLVNQAKASTASSQRSCLIQDSIRTRVGLASLNCGSIVFTDAQADAIRSSNEGKLFKYNRSPLGISMGLSFNVFDGFAREGRVQRAEIDRDNSRHAIRARELAINTAVTAAYYNLMAALRTVELQEQNAAKSRQELTFAEERYRVGAAPFLDVTTSRVTFEQAQIDRVNAIYDYHKAFAALESAVGRPLR